MLRAREIALAGFGLFLFSSTSSIAQVGAMCIPSGVNPALYSDCRLAVAPTGQAVCQCATGPDRRTDPRASGVPGPAGPAVSGGVAAPGAAGPAAAPTATAPTGTAPTAAAPTAAAPTATAAPSPTVTDVGTTGAIANPPGGNPGNDKLNAQGTEPGKAGEKSAGLGGFQNTAPNDGLAQGGTDGGVTAEGQGRSDMK